jgi:hypothetical protein
MAGEMQGVLITKIFGVGTSANDEMGYVECEINHTDRRAIAFTPFDAPQVVIAFLTAAGHLEKKQAMKRGDPNAAFYQSCTPVKAVQIAVDRASEGKNEFMFRMMMESGAALNFGVPRSQIPALVQVLNSAMETANAQATTKLN